MSVFCNKNKEKLRKIKRLYGVSKRATNCATPGYEIFQLWSNMWSTPIFDQLPARGKCCQPKCPKAFRVFRGLRPEPEPHAPKAGALPTALHPDMKLWGGPGVFSQSKRATNCATPGYKIMLIMTAAYFLTTREATPYYTGFSCLVKCSNISDDFFYHKEYNTAIQYNTGGIPL